MVVNVGDDPTPTGSKPVVLPLHQSTIVTGAVGDHRTLQKGKTMSRKPKGEPLEQEKHETPYHYVYTLA